jgi:hypothetical protein
MKRPKRKRARGLNSDGLARGSSPRQFREFYAHTHLRLPAALPQMRSRDRCSARLALLYVFSNDGVRLEPD